MKIQRLIEIIISIRGNTEEPIKKEYSLKEDLHMSSFELMMLIAELEVELKRELRPDIFVGTDTVEDLYERILEISGEKK